MMRAEDPRSFLIENPIFVDAETMEPAEDRKDLAAASARVERCVEIKQCVGFPRHRAGVASMAWRTTR